MTEKELREGLKDYLPAAGLPENRRGALLAKTRAEDASSAAPLHLKGDNEMSKYGKFRMSLVLAAVLLLSFTIALAAGLSGYVDYRGEPVEPSNMAAATPMPVNAPQAPEADPEAEKRAAMFTAVLNDKSLTPDDQLTIVNWQNSADSATASLREVTVTLSSMEELAALWEGVPLPEIPEGFTFFSGNAYLSCAGDSAYELAGQETTPEGITLTHYSIPEGKAVVTSCAIYLKDAEGRHISCLMQLMHDGEDVFFKVNEKNSLKTAVVPGMDEALIIASPDGSALHMRCTLDVPVEVWNPDPYTWNNGMATAVYNEVRIDVQSPYLSPEALLTMFGR